MEGRRSTRQGGRRRPARARGALRYCRRSRCGRRGNRDGAVPSLRHAHHSAVAALSAAHLSAIPFLDTLRRLYIARDSDPAGDGAMITLVVLSPRLDDFNLRQLGIDAIRLQIAVQDVARFMELAAQPDL
jgi:hypothetical protein